ncbi:hypothetical protein H4219_005270 [Mycoemilia scoparia]|uniref:Maintenance of telomere capping protein 1 n=1 Tax=Mycoemilia scoparia TaxID=417184 RepID=A0A9W7ZY92_9FUNG|nr:hypothetical protein H4219_005270 [Mycoemilia scoparia]
MSKARDDVLQFLDTLELNDSKDNSKKQSSNPTNAAATGSDNNKKSDGAAETSATTTTAAKDAQVSNKVDSSDNVESQSKDGKKSSNPKEVLDFLDEITETARKSMSSNHNSTETNPEATSPSTSNTKTNNNSAGGWSWGSLWGQASSIIEQTPTAAESWSNTAFNKLKTSIDTLNTQSQETRKKIESQVKEIIGEENNEKLTKLSGNIVKSLGTVMEHLAPPIPEYTVFDIQFVCDFETTSESKQGMVPVISKTVNSVVEYFDVPGGEVRVKLVNTQELIAGGEEKVAKRGDTFTLEKTFDGVVQKSSKIFDKLTNDTTAATNKDNNNTVRVKDSQGIFQKAHYEKLYLIIEPFQIIPTASNEAMSSAYISLYVALYELPRNNDTDDKTFTGPKVYKTFSQMLPIDVWQEQPPTEQHRMIHTTNDVSTLLNEINEECLVESAMLSVKSLFVEYVSDFLKRPPPPPPTTTSTSSGDVAVANQDNKVSKEKGDEKIESTGV